MKTMEVMAGPPGSEPMRPRLVVSHGRVRRRLSQPSPKPLTNARIAVVMLLASESMLFAGFIGAYLVFRGSSRVWPPAELPRLPLTVTWINTVVLMGSGLSMLASMRAAGDGRREVLVRRLGTTALLGAIFVAVQGSEWARLVRYGFTAASGTYGSTFYVLIGLHGAHVIGALVWLGVVVAGVARRYFRDPIYGVVEACGIYWLYVCVLWLVLFALVYH